MPFELVRSSTKKALPSVTIRAGANMVSDAVTFAVPNDADLAISFHFAGEARGSTLHFAAHQRNYRSAPGDFAAAADFAPDTVTERWHFVAGVDVVNPLPMAPPRRPTRTRAGRMYWRSA